MVGPFIDLIWTLVWNISDLFLQWYYEAADWTFIGSYVSQVCLWVSQLFWSLLTPIANFHDWAVNLENEIATFITTIDIWDILAEPIKWATDAWAWVRYASLYMQDAIDAWWSWVSLTIQSWIDTAIQGVQGLVDNVTTWLGNLQTTWDNFWTLTWPEWMSAFDSLATSWDNFWVVTYPTLLTAFQADGLIDSKLTEWFPFYSTISEFFANPLDWLLDHFADWFLGPEEE